MLEKTNSGNIFFTSDTHFGHSNVIKYCCRSFLTELDKNELEKEGVFVDGVWNNKIKSNWRITPEATEMMDVELINQINLNVQENDVLYHLGDFALPGKQDYYKKCRNYRDKIKCKNLVLIWGNHDDRCIADLFSETYDLKSIRIPYSNNKIILCHYAMAAWEGSHRGNWQLYGHSHSEIELWMDSIISNRKSMDVGVDNAFKILGYYQPFKLENILN